MGGGMILKWGGVDTPLRAMTDDVAMGFPGL